MKTRYARRLRSKRRTRKTRRYRRRLQKGGWPGIRFGPTLTNEKQKETIMFGGWGPTVI